MSVRADSAATLIAAIADVAKIDLNLLPALVSKLNKYPHDTRQAIVALATALGTVSQN